MADAPCGVRQSAAYGLPWSSRPDILNPTVQYNPMWCFYALFFFVPILALVISSRVTRLVAPSLALLLRTRTHLPVSSAFQGKGKWLKWSLSVAELSVVFAFLAACVAIFTLAYQSMAPNPPTITSFPDNPPFSKHADKVVALVGRCFAHVAEFAMGLLLMPVTRRGIVLYFMGIPYERALRYHRYLVCDKFKSLILLCNVSCKGPYFGNWCNCTCSCLVACPMGST
eukprot:m.157012 g.157012  ORF g.157012 m.157012 type:complete len:227 (-) comp15106_c0_seq11:1199-1879(-)